MDKAILLLAVVFPDLETGRNGKDSWNRTRAKCVIIPRGTNVRDYFSENAEGNVYITVPQAKSLERDFGLLKPQSVYVKRINTRSQGVKEIEVRSFPCIRYTKNGGISAEFNVSYEYGWTFASREEDKNGIDFHCNGYDVQLKSFGFGIEELNNYLTTGVKKSGISVCNATLESLQAIVDGLE